MFQFRIQTTCEESVYAWSSLSILAEKWLCNLIGCMFQQKKHLDATSIQSLTSYILFHCHLFVSEPVIEPPYRKLVILLLRVLIFPVLNTSFILMQNTQKKCDFRLALSHFFLFTKSLVILSKTN